MPCTECGHDDLDAVKIDLGPRMFECPECGNEQMREFPAGG